MKSKYTQIIDADEEQPSILKRAQAKLVSDKDERKRFDILVASREKVYTAPSASRERDQVSHTIGNMIEKNGISATGGSKHAGSILGHIADLTLDKKSRDVARDEINYRESKKEKSEKRRK